MPSVPIQNKKLHYQTWGRGEPFLFVHGWGGSCQSLTLLAKLFANSNKSFVIDLPGFGASEKPESTWGIKEYAEVINEFISKLRLKNLTYFGHSFGGSLGIYLAAHNKNLFDRLILCAPSFKRESEPSSLSKLFHWIPSPIKKIVYRVFFPNSDLYTYPHLEQNFRKIVTEDLTSQLLKIRTKTLIIWGKEDKQTPFRNAETLSKKIRDSLLVTVPNAGHNLPLINPQLVYKEIKSFYGHV